MKPIAWLLALLLSGCTMAPKYQRPDNLTTGQFRSAGALDKAPGASSEKSFGDLGWWAVFNDETLQALIRQGLKNNYDVRIAAARVLEARAQLTAAQAGLFPSLTANAQAKKTDAFQIGEESLPPPVTKGAKSATTAINLAWELDFWGRVRNANTAAKAQLLATEAGREAVIQSLVAGIAQAYLELRELDLELETAKRTLDSRTASLRLVQARKDRGVASRLDVRQSEVLVSTAAATIPSLEGQIAQKENLLSTLIGANPDAMPRGKRLVEQQLAPEVPAGLPASLLERRPDIIAAEQGLIAANAVIGEARAAYFPQITLTAMLGTVTPALSSLFQGPAGATAIAPTAVWPLFNAGKVRAGVIVAKARRDQALLAYQQTVQQALREVADALIGYQKAREVRVQQEALTASLKDAANLSELRYRGGVSSYLEVLDSERQLFDAELNLAKAKRNELLSVVALYKALGGGWQSEPVAALEPDPAK